MENPRECALDVLIKVDKKEELSHIAISNVLEKYQFSEKRDRAFFTRLVEGTLERQITIDYVFKNKDQKMQTFDQSIASHGNLPDPLHGSGTRFSSM
jgi:16S rRNA (cytosine967-C5)-methyltransferase